MNRKKRDSCKQGKREIQYRFTKAQMLYDTFAKNVQIIYIRIDEEGIL